MALLLCNECKNIVSNKADNCPHCGVKIKKSDNPKICVINGQEYDLTSFYEKCMELSKIDVDALVPIISDLRKLTNIVRCFKLCEIMIKTREVPATFNDKTMQEIKQEQVHCKYCNSTNVKKLRYNAWNFGNQWHCNKCGSDF